MKYGGIGIGLAVSKTIIEAQGGTIRCVEQEPGQPGATFQFTIPIACPVRDRPEYLRGFHPLRVLAIDDNATTLQLLSSELSHWGMRATLVGSYDEALRLVSAWPKRDSSGNSTESSGIDPMPPYDAVILDLQMPSNCNGFVLAQQIRQHFSKSQLPILLLCSAQDRQPDFKPVVNAYVTKPIKPSLLFQALTGKSPGSARHAGQFPKPPTAGEHSGGVIIHSCQLVIKHVSGDSLSPGIQSGSSCSRSLFNRSTPAFVAFFSHHCQHPKTRN